MSEDKGLGGRGDTQGRSSHVLARAHRDMAGGAGTGGPAVHRSWRSGRPRRARTRPSRPPISTSRNGSTLRAERECGPQVGEGTRRSTVRRSTGGKCRCHLRSRSSTRAASREREASDAREEDTSAPRHRTAEQGLDLGPIRKGMPPD